MEPRTIQQRAVVQHVEEDSLSFGRHPWRLARGGLLPDNDEAGEKLTERIISDLIGVVNSIKVVKTSERDHGDVTDYFQDGYTIEDFNKLVREAKTIPQNQGQEVDKPKKKKEIPQWIKDKVAELKPEVNYSLDDRGNGDLFADVFKGVCRFNSTARCWFCYNGKYWEEDSSDLIDTVCICPDLRSCCLEMGLYVCRVGNCLLYTSRCV